MGDTAFLSPPPSDGANSKLRCIVRHTDHDITRVLRHVIDTIGNRETLRLAREIILVNLRCFSTPCSTFPSEVADQLFLLVLRQNSWVNSGNSVPPFPRGKRELFPRSSAGICVSNCFPERGCHPAGLGIGLSWPKQPFSRGPNRMHLKTLLNRVEPHQSFVYGEVRFCNADRSALEVVIRERANGRPICSGCGRAGPGYDRLSVRRYAFVPLWAMAVFLVYAPRRVACPRCGVKVERVPWAEGKSRLTNSYQWFLASWAKLLAWQQVATVFHTSWQSVYRSVQRAVAWGLAHRNLDGIEAIGVDEVQWQKGHHYLTLVYQIDGSCRRLLHIAPERTMRSLLSFFRLLGKTRSAALKFVCSDMWQPYLKVIA